MGSITASGGSTIYFDDEDNFQINTDTPLTVASIGGWPITIENNGSGYLKVVFRSDITLTSAYQYFICGSEYIQFGDTSLRPNGERASITIQNITNYPGLIQNGQDVAPGYSNIRVLNLFVNAAGTISLAGGGGWVGQEFFGCGATNNVIINCIGRPDISVAGGGIVGANAGSTFDPSGSELTIIGCSSRASTIQEEGGGIAGNNFYSRSGSAFSAGTIVECYSIGKIYASGGGSIGAGASNNAPNAITISKCYSVGDICGNSTGGIVGKGSFSILVENTYSRGNINVADSGGIFSSSGGDARANNCYSTGTIGTTSGGIMGFSSGGGGVATNCYTSGKHVDTDGNFDITGNGIYKNDANDGPTNYGEANHANTGIWQDICANGVLIGTPTVTAPVSSVWTFDPINPTGPYIFSSFGYTPYSVANIDTSGTSLTLNKIYRQTILPGGNTPPALITGGHQFYILAINGAAPSPDSPISIELTTGVITTTPNIAPGTYDIVVYDGFQYVYVPASPYLYTTTRVLLTVVELPVPPCCAPTEVYSGLDGDTITSFRTGNRLIVERATEPAMRFPSHTFYMKYKMALGAKK